MACSLVRRPSQLPAAALAPPALLPGAAPGWHTSHLPAASPELVPAGHAWHVSLAALSLNMPGLQGLQKFDPSLDTW